MPGLQIRVEGRSAQQSNTYFAWTFLSRFWWQNSQLQVWAFQDWHLICQTLDELKPGFTELCFRMLLHWNSLRNDEHSLQFWEFHSAFSWIHAFGILCQPPRWSKDNVDSCDTFSKTPPIICLHVGFITMIWNSNPNCVATAHVVTFPLMPRVHSAHMIACGQACGAVLRILLRWVLKIRKSRKERHWNFVTQGVLTLWRRTSFFDCCLSGDTSATEVEVRSMT